MFVEGNYQDFQRYPEVDLAMAADAEATLPSLIEAVKRLIDRRSQARVRGARPQAGRRRGSGCSSARAAEAAYALGREPDQHRAAVGGTVGADQGRGLVARVADRFVSRWPLRLWDFDKPYQFIGALGRRGRRLRRAGGGRRGAREQEARAACRSPSRPTAI